MKTAVPCMTSAFVDSALIRCVYSHKQCFLFEKTSTVLIFQLNHNLTKLGFCFETFV